MSVNLKEQNFVILPYCPKNRVAYHGAKDQKKLAFCDALNPSPLRARLISLHLLPNTRQIMVSASDTTAYGGDFHIPHDFSSLMPDTTIFIEKGIMREGGWFGLGRHSVAAAK